jgi:hypothetical protein
MSGGGNIDISKLNVQQLTYLVKQLEEENTLLTANFNQLKQAHAKFLDAAACMKILGDERERELLMVDARVREVQMGEFLILIAFVTLTTPSLLPEF